MEKLTFDFAFMHKPCLYRHHSATRHLFSSDSDDSIAGDAESQHGRAQLVVPGRCWSSSNAEKVP